MWWIFGGGGGEWGNCPVFEGVWTGRTNDPSYAGGAATVLTLNFPAAPVDNLLIAVCGVGFNPSTVGPTGWNQIVGGLNDAVGGGNPIECQLNVFWKLADGTETSANFDFGPNPRQAAGAVLRYSDVNAASPIGPHGTASGVSTTPQAPSIVTTEDANRVLRVALADAEQSQSLLQNPPDDSRFSRASTEPFGPGSSYTMDAVVIVGSDDCQPTAGASGTADWSVPASEEWVALSVAIRPASDADVA